MPVVNSLCYRVCKLSFCGGIFVLFLVYIVMFYHMKISSIKPASWRKRAEIINTKVIQYPRPKLYEILPVLTQPRTTTDKNIGESVEATNKDTGEESLKSMNGLSNLNNLTPDEAILYQMFEKLMQTLLEKGLSLNQDGDWSKVKSNLKAHGLISTNHAKDKHRHNDDDDDDQEDDDQEDDDLDEDFD